jgi:hypothetical protein
MQICRLTTSQPLTPEKYTPTNEEWSVEAPLQYLRDDARETAGLLDFAVEFQRIDTQIRLELCSAHSTVTRIVRVIARRRRALQSTAA